MDIQIKVKLETLMLTRYIAN